MQPSSSGVPANLHGDMQVPNGTLGLTLPSCLGSSHTACKAAGAESNSNSNLNLHVLSKSVLRTLTCRGTCNSAGQGAEDPNAKLHAKYPKEFNGCRYTDGGNSNVKTAFVTYGASKYV